MCLRLSGQQRQAEKTTALQTALNATAERGEAFENARSLCVLIVYRGGHTAGATELLSGGIKRRSRATAQQGGAPRRRQRHIGTYVVL